MIESFKLPFHFSASEVKTDLAHFAEADWLPHFNTHYYSGNWNGLVLRAPGGNASTLYPNPNSTDNPADTALMQYFPSIKKIMNSFECNMRSVRLLRLERGAIIREHSDNALSFEEGEIRVHVPITTNEQVEFISNGERLDLREGECWYINATLPHSVANRGENDRIHLVIDCDVNDWLRSLFPEISPGEVAARSAHEYSRKDIESMVELLRNMGTPTANAMADEIEKNGTLSHE